MRQTCEPVVDGSLVTISKEHAVHVNRASSFLASAITYDLFAKFFFFIYLSLIVNICEQCIYLFDQ